ncbi:MAG: acyltransferase [Synechococcus sp.]
MADIREWLWYLLSRAPNHHLVYHFRSRIAAKILGHASKCITFMQNIRLNHPKQILIGEAARIGPDCFLGAGSSASEKLLVGSNVYIGPRAYIDASDGGISIGDDVLIGPNVVLRASNHVFSDPAIPIRLQGTCGTGIVIEEDVWLGANVVIIDGVTIGRGAVIGAGAVVTKSIPSYAVAVGVPAKVISSRLNINMTQTT